MAAKVTTLIYRIPELLNKGGSGIIPVVREYFTWLGISGFIILIIV